MATEGASRLAGRGEGLRRVLVYGMLAVLAVSLTLVGVCRRLGDLYDPDEWYVLGANLSVHGVLGVGEHRMAYRPPGYPFFIALVLRTFVTSPPRLTPEYLVNTRSALYVVQAFVISGLFGSALLWWSRRLSLPMALAASLALCLNPMVLVLATLPHYSLVHLTLLVVGSWALTSALGARRPTLALFAAGALWGAATLVRPMTLVLPLLFPLLLREKSWRSTLRKTLGFAMGLGLVVAPWTLRNAALRGRFIPVSAQAWTVLWGSTTRPLPIDPDHFNFYLVVDDSLPIFRAATGSPRFSTLALAVYDVKLEDAFRAEVLANLSAHPTVYLGNVARSLVSIVTCTSGVLVKLHEYAQGPGGRLHAEWFRPGHPQDGGGPSVALGYEIMSTALLPAAIAGVVLAWRRRDRFLLPVLVVFGCMTLVHAFTYMDLYYYYFRLPPLVFLAFYAFDGQDRLGASLPGCRKLTLGALAAGATTGGFLVLSAALLVRSVWPG